MDRWVLVGIDECGDEYYITEVDMPTAEDDDMEMDIEMILDMKAERMRANGEISMETQGWRWTNKSRQKRDIWAMVRDDYFGGYYEDEDEEW